MSVISDDLKQKIQEAGEQNARIIEVRKMAEAMIGNAALIADIQSEWFLALPPDEQARLLAIRKEAIATLFESLRHQIVLAAIVIERSGHRGLAKGLECYGTGLEKLSLEIGFFFDQPDLT